MMKKLARRPEVESLESMTLLSGMAAPAIPNPIHLVGSIKFNVKIHHDSIDESASGSIKPLGRYSTSGDATWLLKLLEDTDDSQSFTLTTKAGNLFVSVAGLTQAPDGDYVTQYTITGGTKAYAGETGSGTIVAPQFGRGRFNFS